MEAQILVTVRGESAAELAAKIESIQFLAGGPAPDTPPIPSPAPFPPVPSGLIDLGEASGKRGDTVRVEIRGHATIPVMGFAAAVGYETDHLAFHAVEWGSVWSEGGATPHVIAGDARDRAHPFVGNAGPHVMLAIARFRIKSTAPGASGPSAGETYPPVRLEQGTLLAALIFRIADAAPIGKALPLLNRSLKFGRPPIDATYMTRSEEGPQIHPELNDGSIVVIG